MVAWLGTSSGVMMEYSWPHPACPARGDGDPAGLTSGTAGQGS